MILLEQFHFIRPYCLLLILPGILMAVLLLRREKNRNAWQRLIDPMLLAPLLQGKINRNSKKLPLLFLLFWIVCALALAGPTWEKLPTPIEKRDSALVILMDLSPSMLAGDVKPSRLVAARHKILDLLNLRKEGNTALIAYSGDAHVVSPLTDDNKTIANLLNVLEPGIMPSYGSNIEDALTQALQLFQSGGYTQGDILLITDGITSNALENSVAILKGKAFTLSIIGVGSEAGAPIPGNNGDFIKDNQGKIVLPQLHEELLLSLAQKTNGYYNPIQLDDRDIAPLVEGTKFFNPDSIGHKENKKTEREFDQWRDIGGIVTLLLLPLILISFRRGVLVSLFLLVPLLHIADVKAETDKTPDVTTSSFHLPSFHLPSWDDIWLNDNQRAMKAMKANDYASAAKNFKDPDWKASAQYEAGDYESAFKHFKNDSSAKGDYNQANSLAKSGQLEAAINAYKEALKKNPQFEDAVFNKKIVEQLLEQQQKQNQDQKQDKKDQSGKQSQDDQDKNDQRNNQQNSQPDEKSGNKQQNQSSEQDKQDAKEAQKAHETDKSDNEAQTQKGEQGKNQSDQNAGTQSGQQDNTNKPDQSGKDPDKAAKTNAESKLTPEQKQALEQWLRQVPDDPSGLLRNKFQYYYQQRLQDQQNGKAQRHTNDEERW